MSPLSRKRPLDGDDAINTLPKAKRQTVQAIASLVSSSPISARKRSREVSDDDDEPTQKRSREDFEYRNPLYPEIVDPKELLAFRMNLNSIIQGCSTWEMYCEMLNAIPDFDHQLLFLALHDLPESARLKAFAQLQDDSKRYQHLIKNISNVQAEKSLYDPKSLFPSISTPYFLATLPSSARLCFICSKKFKDGASIIWKSCAKHTLHEECLRTRINDLHTPLFGRCGCASED